MNAILGMTEAALDTDLSPEQRECLDIVKASADSLLTIINDILDLGKIEAGKFELDPVPFDLAEVVGDALKTLALRAHQKGLELVLDVDPRVPDGLIGDDARLRQVLINLVGNAIKFTESGEVVVAVRARAPRRPTGADAPLHGRRHRDRHPRREARLDLRAVHPGRRLDHPPLRRHRPGPDDLARLVEMMGGRIWVESEAGAAASSTSRPGSMTDRPPPPAPDIGLASVPRGTSRVLLVDDNADGPAGRRADAPPSWA